MFKLANNKKIGEYLLKLITENYESTRKFCQAYIRASGGIVNNDETRKMANRICQIIKGKKSIQIYDLPIFTKLLNASCEEILSAGKTFMPDNNRLTNYIVSFSKDKNVWDEYINHKDKLILNPDEYNNTVIDYAIRFKNFEFIKYLMDNDYIWFVDENARNYLFDFGAGTSIKGRDVRDWDYGLEKSILDTKLRIKLIILSLECNNLDILKNLHAREIPDYYHISYHIYRTFDIYRYYDPDFIANIANASNEIIDYFTDVFEVKDLIKYSNGIKGKNEFMFPFISELLDKLIKNEHEFTEFALRNAIKHNQRTYDKIKKLINEGAEDLVSQRCWQDDEEIIKRQKRFYLNSTAKNFKFLEDVNIVYLRLYTMTGMIGIETNITHVKSKSKDIKINYLIKDLNDYYNKIVNIKDEFKI